MDKPKVTYNKVKSGKYRVHVTEGNMKVHWTVKTKTEAQRVARDIRSGKVKK